MMHLPRWLTKLLGRHFPRTLGAKGENLAAQFARKDLRYTVLARNVLCPGGELDLIALDGSVLVFIEVRTRATEDFGSPETTIRHNKKRFLIRSARWYLRTRRGKTKNLIPRFDVIVIVWPSSGKPTIRHHRNVFAIGH